MRLAWNRLAIRLLAYRAGVLPASTSRLLAHSASTVVKEERMKQRLSAESQRKDRLGRYPADFNYDQWVKSLGETQREHLKQVHAEYEILKYTDEYMPDVVHPYEWKHILSLETRQDRIHYLTYLYTKEVQQEQEQREKEAKRKELAEKENDVVAQLKAEFDEGKLIYKLHFNSIFHRIRTQTMIKFYCQRCAAEFACGDTPTLVLDFGFYERMSYIDQSQTARHMRMLFGENRSSRTPLRVVLTSVDQEADWWEEITRRYLCDFKNEYGYMAETTPKSYLDLFPKEKLIYLTPEAREPLSKVDSDHVYVLGAMIDKGNKFSTYAKAREQGIATRRLPLDEYVKFRRGTKHLPVVQVARILREAHAEGDWRKALLDSIPQRKLDDKERVSAKVVRKRGHERRIRLTQMLAGCDVEQASLRLRQAQMQRKAEEREGLS